MNEKEKDSRDSSREQSDEKDPDKDDSSNGAAKQDTDGEASSDTGDSGKDSGSQGSGDQESADGEDSGKNKDENEKEDDDHDDEDQDEDEDEDEDEKEDEDDVIKVARTPTSPALLSRLRHSREYDQARGLGAGGTGAAMFHVQRITALALIPLAIWFGVSVVRLSTATRAVAAHWLAWPVNAAIMASFIVIALRHAVIGLQIIFEDYIHDAGLRAACVLAVKAIALIVGVGAVAALIHISI